MSRLKSLFDRFSILRLNTVIDMEFYIRKRCYGISNTFKLESTNRIDFIRKMKYVDSKTIGDLHYLYGFELVDDSHKIFLLLYMCYDETHPVFITFNDGLLNLNISFDKRMFNNFIQRYHHVDSSDIEILLMSVFDKENTSFSTFFLNQCITEWHQNNNPDYLLMYLKSYKDLIEDDLDFKDWFPDDNPLRDHMLDILCLINDNHPQLIGIESTMEHEPLISAYSIANVMNIPFLEVLNRSMESINESIHII